MLDMEKTLLCRKLEFLWHTFSSIKSHLGKRHSMQTAQTLEETPIASGALTIQTPQECPFAVGAVAYTRAPINGFLEETL